MNQTVKHILSIKSYSPATIGLLGGSFNPPHLGHLHISKLAIKRLNLTNLFWLVSPKNPFKAPAQHSIEKRAQLCSQLINNNNLQKYIKVSTLEKDLNSVYSVYTFHTINTLLKLLPKNIKLIWIMGEDLLINFHKFYRWKELMNLINIFVVARGEISNYDGSFNNLQTKFTNVAKPYLVKDNLLTSTPAPAWSFALTVRNNLSSQKLNNAELKQLNETKIEQSCSTIHNYKN